MGRDGRDAASLMDAAAAGDRRAVARLLSMVERGGDDARAAGALARLALAVGPDGTALAVSHGGVVHTLERALGVRREGRLPNLGGRWFEVGPGHLAAGEPVLLVDEDEVTVPGQL